MANYVCYVYIHCYISNKKSPFIIIVQDFLLCFGLLNEKFEQKTVSNERMKNACLNCNQFKHTIIYCHLNFVNSDVNRLKKKKTNKNITKTTTTQKNNTYNDTKHNTAEKV